MAKYCALILVCTCFVFPKMSSACLSVIVVSINMFNTVFSLFLFLCVSLTHSHHEVVCRMFYFSRVSLARPFLVYTTVAFFHVYHLHNSIILKSFVVFCIYYPCSLMKPLLNLHPSEFFIINHSSSSLTHHSFTFYFLFLEAVTFPFTSIHHG